MMAGKSYSSTVSSSKGVILMMIVLCTTNLQLLQVKAESQCSNHPNCSDLEFRYYWGYWPMPYESVGRGKSVTLYCNDYKENRFCLCPETTGHSIKWFKFEDGIKTEITENSAHVKKRGHDKLFLKDMGIEDSGLFSCELRSAENEILLKRNYTVLVHKKGKISMPVMNVMYSGTVHINSADKDTNGELDCSFQAMGPSVITWYKNDKLLNAHSDKYDTKLEPGAYKCKVSTSVGKFSQKFIVQ